MLGAAEELIRRGHTVDCLIYTTPGYPVDDYVRMLTNAGSEVTEMVLAGNISLRVFLKTRTFLKHHRYDIVHTHLVHGDWYGISAARHAGYKYIISTKYNDDPFRKGFLFRSIEKHLTRKCSKVLTISEWLKTFAVQMGVPEEKIDVVYYGMKSPEIDKNSKPELRKELDIPVGDIVYLIAARLIPQKGHTYLLEAFRKLRSEADNVLLLIAGEGKLEKELKQKADSLGLGSSVRFLGFRKDIHSVMRSCDVFVHPSLWEGFGIVLLEAMHASLPVVASDVSAIPEVVADGETGFCVPFKDSDTLYARMKQLLNDPGLRAEMGSRGKQRAQQMFTPEQMGDGLERAYREMRESLKTP